MQHTNHTISQYQQTRQHYFDQVLSQINSTISNWAQSHQSNQYEQVTQSPIQSVIGSDLSIQLKKVTINKYITELKQSCSQLLQFQTLQALEEHFGYVQVMLSNKIKLATQRSEMSMEGWEIQKGHKFSKKANLILKEWLYTNFSYPYPTKEQAVALANQCNLTYKQIQIWFINARGRISTKVYNQKKFKNLVKSRYLTMCQGIHPSSDV